MGQLEKHGQPGNGNEPSLDTRSDTVVIGLKCIQPIRIRKVKSSFFGCTRDYRRPMLRVVDPSPVYVSQESSNSAFRPDALVLEVVPEQLSLVTKVPTSARVHSPYCEPGGVMSISPEVAHFFPDSPSR